MVAAKLFSFVLHTVYFFYKKISHYNLAYIMHQSCHIKGVKVLL